MRRLLPSYADDVDLDEAYAYPTGRPWLRANMVASVDGSAAEHGLSGGLSGSGDKRIFGVLRGLADVVLVGAGTVRAEGYGPARARPSYAERRGSLGQAPAPAIAVVTNRLDLDLEQPIFAEAEVRTIVVTSEAAPIARRDAAAEVADVVLAGAGRVDVPTAVAALVERGHTRLLCEGGPGLLSQVAGSGRLDELCMTRSPVLIAGDGPRALSGPELDPRLGLRIGHLLEDDGFLFARYLTG